MKPKKDDQEPLLNVGDVNLAPRETVSATLRRHRKQTGQDLKAVAEALRIRYVYLEAIEQGRYDALPGPTYALGFIKTYAEYLELDEDEIVQQFREDVDGLDDQTQLVFPSPVPEGKVPGGAILLVALLMGSMAYGGWHYLSNRDSGFADFIPALPDRLQALFDGEASSDTELAGISLTPTPATPSASDNTAGSAEPAPAAETAPVASDAGQASTDETAAAVVAETQPAPEPAQESATSSGAVTSTPAAPQVTAEVTVANDPVATVTSSASSSPAPQPQVTTQAPETTSSNLEQDTVAVATLAAPSSSDASTPSRDTANLSQSTTVISSQSVTNQVAAVNQVDATEIPAAPAAPVTTQTVTVPDATQPQVYGEDNADARIILRATQDAWVQVRDSANELLLTRVLREGDVYRVPNQEGLTLLTGNAGGIDVLVDGTLLAPLGPVGSVRRDLALDPQGLLAGTTAQ